MWIIIRVASVLSVLSNANEVCDSTKCYKRTYEPLQWSNFEKCESVSLNNKSIENIQQNQTSDYSSLKKLDLSHNKLRQLPEYFLSTAKDLVEINLSNNILEELPESFLNHSFNLKVLQLEGNRLTKIPASVFQSSLLNLSVDCQCDVVRSIMQNLNNQTDLFVTCKASHFEKANEFFEKNCGSRILLVVYILAPIVAIILIAVIVGLHLRKKKTSATFGGKTATDMSPTHGQPRYTSRTMDVMASTSNQGTRQDYENVFVGQLQTDHAKPHEYSKSQSRAEPTSKQPLEEDIYLESDVNEGDQPIYSNTQGVYYNYCDQGDTSTNKEEDDVYILPDH